MPKTKEEYIFLQKDLGVIGDFLHSYRKDLADEFIKNLHHYKLPKDHFTKLVSNTETNTQVVPKVLNDYSEKQLHGDRVTSRNPLNWKLPEVRRIFKKKKKSDDKSTTDENFTDKYKFSQEYFLKKSMQGKSVRTGSHKFSYGAGMFNVMSVLKFLPENVRLPVFKSMWGQNLRTQIAILWHLYKGRKNMYETMRGHAIREISTVNAWQMKPILYNQNWVWEPESKIDQTVWQEHNGITFGTTSTYATIKKHYPKLTEMVDKLRSEYGIDSVQKVTYSILTAHGDISVHTGRDNIHSRYVRCHIPLIIPEHTKDEMYLEANGDKVYWTETWGFDNQTPHTAKNATSYHRLILIIDISRKALGLKEKKTSNSTFVQKNALRYRFMKRYLRVLLKQGRDYN